MELLLQRPQARSHRGPRLLHPDLSLQASHPDLSLRRQLTVHPRCPMPILRYLSSQVELLASSPPDLTLQAEAEAPAVLGLGLALSLTLSYPT